MSTEIRQELKIVPAQASVVKHVRYTYACRRCDREAVTVWFLTWQTTPLSLCFYLTRLSEIIAPTLVP